MNFLNCKSLSISAAKFFALWFVAAIYFVAPATVFADSAEKLFKEAQRSYKQLLNKDPRISSLSEWEKVAQNLRTVALKHKKTSYAPRAAFLAAYLSEHQYRILKLEMFLARSISYYNYLLYEFKGDKLSENALIALGDLYRFDVHDEGSARRAYLRIVREYPTGEMFLRAKQRLEEIRTGEIPLTLKQDKKKIDPAPGVIISREHRQRRPLVVVDPGHGGAEDGALGHDGVWEKDVVLSLSFKLERFLQDYLRARVILTRRSDIDVPLSGRTELANQQQADLFISVHANASVKKNARGIETYYLDNTNDASSLRLAERENQAFKRESDDLAFILSDLIQNAKLGDSISLSHHLQDSLVKTLSEHYKDIVDLGVKKAPFYVLVGAHMPCALVEVSFIDHPVEGKRLLKDGYQELIARSLYLGVQRYFAENGM